MYYVGGEVGSYDMEVSGILRHSVPGCSRGNPAALKSPSSSYSWMLFKIFTGPTGVAILTVNHYYIVNTGQLNV